MQLCTFEQITERIDGKAHFRCTGCGRIAYHCRSEASKIFAQCGSPRPNQPTWLEMAATAATAAAQLIASGGKVVEPETRAGRLAICEECPAYDQRLVRCNECGCFLAAKTWLPGQKCPLGKW